MKQMAAYGRLPNNAVEEVPNWICIKEISIPAANGKMAFYGETVALAQDMPTAKMLAASAEMLETLKAFVAAEDDWNDRDGTFDDPLTDVYNSAKAILVKLWQLP